MGLTASRLTLKPASRSKVLVLTIRKYEFRMANNRVYLLRLVHCSSPSSGAGEVFSSLEVVLMDRVAVFIDYQNVHLTAYEKFAPFGVELETSHINPAKLGQLIVDRRPYESTLIDVRVYRGLPSIERQRTAAMANERQADAWQRQTVTSVYRRPLRYPFDWPNSSAQEKGVDVALAIDFVRLASEKCYNVGILFSRDTDLVPCLETVFDLRLAHIEVASWEGCGRLRLPGGNGSALWCHWLTHDDYKTVMDQTDYRINPTQRIKNSGR